MRVRVRVEVGVRGMSKGPSQDKSRQVKTGQDRSRQVKTSQDKARHVKTRRDK